MSTERVGSVASATMDHDDLADWINRYEHAWRSAGSDALADVFTDDAVYRHSPYADPVVGRTAIAELWESERDGPDEIFTLATDVVAVDGDTAVARALVRYGDPVAQEYTDLWVVRFDGDRAREFEEWPFWPCKAWTASGEAD